MDSPDQPAVTILDLASQRKRRRRRYLMVVTLIFIGIVIWLWLNKPAVGSVNNSATYVSAASGDDYTTTLKGHYVSISHPSSLTVKRNEYNKQSASEQLFLHRESNNPATNFSVAITVLPIADSLAEIAAATLRREQSGVYREGAFDEHPGILFTKKVNGYEKTLLWQEYGRTYSVSLTVPTHSQQADELFILIMKNLVTQP